MVSRLLSHNFGNVFEIPKGQNHTIYYGMRAGAVGGKLHNCWKTVRADSIVCGDSICIQTAIETIHKI
jgi:hypothetical protein